jgi:tetratricopeptide (TPR) repeat protein
MMQKAGTMAVAAALLGAGICAASSATAQTEGEPEATPNDYPPCETSPDEASMQAAQGAFQAGNASFNEADYPRAIFYWEDAYRRDCTAHAMLKNLARAYELNEQFRHAIHALETYLERNPDSGEEEAIQRRIKNLQEKLEERERLAAVPIAPPPKQQPAKTEPKPKPSPEPQSEPVEFDFSDPEEDEGPKRPIAPLIVAGAGGVLGIVGGVQWAIARQDELDAEGDCGPGGRADCAPEAKQRGNDALDRQLLWGIVGGAGAAIAAGGIIWYFVQEPTGDDESIDDDYTRVSPQLGAGFAGVSFEGNF